MSQMLRNTQQQQQQRVLSTQDLQQTKIVTPQKSSNHYELLAGMDSTIVVLPYLLLIISVSIAFFFLC
jgi:hypothetical protein